MNSIKEKIDSSTLVELMSASNIFGRGFGEKRFTSILKMYPDILTSNIDDSEKINMVTKIDGIADKTAQHFVENIPNFKVFLDEHPILKPRIIKKIIRKKIAGPQPDFKFKGQVFVLSGTRDSRAVEYIEKNGGVIGDVINSKTTTLIVKSLEKKNHLRPIREK